MEQAEWNREKDFHSSSKPLHIPNSENTLRRGRFRMIARVFVSCPEDLPNN